MPGSIDIVLMTGCNAGKSSLLESITKCPVFPRGANMTTRAPVCLRMEHIASSDSSVTQISVGSGPVEHLSSEAAIVDAVCQRMEAIPEGTISKTAINIRICKPEVPTMEIIDLPGILEGSLKAPIVDIVNKYLALPETLVLCVVDAPFAHLGSSQAIQLVRDHRKEAKTIITLTKADNVHPGQVEQQIIQRVLRERPGEDITDFAGCVAVINRQHQDQVTLLEASDVEQRMFRTQVFKPAPAWCGLVVGQVISNRQAEVEQHITITKLIEQVVRLYCDYVRNTWKPQALQIMGGLMEPALADLHSLGMPPGPHLHVQQVLDHASNTMDWKSLAVILEDISFPFCHEDSMIPQPIALQLPAAALYRCLPPYRQSRSAWLSNAGKWLTPVAPKSLDHAEFLLHLDAAVRSAIERWIGDCWYVKDAKHAVIAAFASRTTMRLDRFSELKEAILSNLPAMISTSDMKQQVFRDIEPQLSLLGSGYYAPGPPLCEALAKLDLSVRLKVCQKFTLQLKKEGLAQCVPEGFELREDPGYQLIRNNAARHVENLRDATIVIHRIEQDMADAGA